MHASPSPSQSLSEIEWIGFHCRPVVFIVKSMLVMFKITPLKQKMYFGMLILTWFGLIVPSDSDFSRTRWLMMQQTNGVKRSRANRKKMSIDLWVRKVFGLWGFLVFQVRRPWSIYLIYLFLNKSIVCRLKTRGSRQG